MTEEWLKRRFPRLAEDGFRVTSDATTVYNCVGWAVEDDRNWWSPEDFELYYWPEGAPRDWSVEAWTAAFTVVGFEPCDGAELEPEYVRSPSVAGRGTRSTRRASFRLAAGPASWAKAWTSSTSSTPSRATRTVRSYA